MSVPALPAPLPLGTGDSTLPPGRPGIGKPAVVIGDKNFDEEYLLGALYAGALRAKGFSVRLANNIGTSQIIDDALVQDRIDLYPEYTGVIYSVLAGRKDIPRSAAETLAGATAFENKRGFAVLNPTPFQDADAVATTKAYARRHGLKTIDDLKKVGSFTYGAPPENATRYQGVIGLQQAYGLHPKLVPLPIGKQYAVLDKGNVDTIAIFTTDGQLASGKYAVLTDTKNIFGFQQVVPVVNQAVLAKEGPAFQATLNAVSKLLTPDAIVAMNKAVQLDGKTPAVVAHQFLSAHHII